MEWPVTVVKNLSFSRLEADALAGDLAAALMAKL